LRWNRDLLSTDSKEMRWVDEDEVDYIPVSDVWGRIPLDFLLREELSFKVTK